MAGDYCLTNSPNIIKAIEDFQEVLDVLKDFLRKGEAEKFLKSLSIAKKRGDNVLFNLKNNEN